MYLKSDVVNAIFGDDGGEKLLHFIRGCVIPHEQSFCFYLRKGVRHFETTTNSGHEGTNNALKSGPTRVLPQHAIDKSTKIQVDKDLTKFDLYRRHVSATMFGTATWSSSLTVNDITLPAEFMLKFAVEECDNYASWRKNPDTWLVVRSVERDLRSLIPRFRRVYTVSLHPFDSVISYLTCDCKYFECNGMVCQHMAHVKKFYGKHADITHHDVSVRWWKSYLYFATKAVADCSSTERKIKRDLEHRRRNDCKGPNFTEKDHDDNVLSPFNRIYRYGEHSQEQFHIATEGNLARLFKDESVIDRVINYSRDEVIVALNSTSTNIPLSMSQEVYMQESSEETPYDDDDDDDDDNEWFVESTVESSRIDFGERAHEECEHDLSSYDPYQSIMPKVKELVTILAASNSCRELGTDVELALDNFISDGKAILASQKPPPKGNAVSSCPVGKLKKTKVSGWSR
jgi:hypothetical protein